MRLARYLCFYRPSLLLMAVISCTVVQAQELSEDPVYFLAQSVKKMAEQQPRSTETNTPQTPSTEPSSVEKVQTSAQVTIDADEQRKEGDVFIASGYVVITYGASRLQADKVIYNSTTGEASAEGNVIYDPDPFQRITARRAVINILSKRGTFYEATGFTDQTPDGETLNFTAERVEKTGRDTYLLYGVSLSACAQAVPVWQFEAAEADLQVNKSATIRGSVFRFKDIPLLYLPAVKLPLGRQPRKSGFLIPTMGSSKQRGFTIFNSYYQTLGRSADLLLRGDVYTKRALGFGATLRFRTDELSSVRLGHYTVFDRVFGSEKEPDESGTLFFAKGVQYLPGGFIAAVDVDYTSDLAFRRTFANDAEQIFNPENRSQFYLMNHFSTKQGNYSFYIRAERKKDTLFSTRGAFDPDPEQEADPNVIIKISHLPSVELTGYDQQIPGLPLYYSFEVTAESLAREDSLGRRLDFTTPRLVQRFDLAPRLVWILPDIKGWVIRPELRGRATYYSSSLRTEVAPAQPGLPLDIRRQIDTANTLRSYGEFVLDIRPPSLAKVYKDADGEPRFKHLIEPFFAYRKIEGVRDFDRVIKFDYRDAVADTNEIEYGITNRIFVPKVGEQGGVSTHELLAFTLTQKYFFDPTFGGALKAGTRNQFFPINTLSGFTFGGRERRFSPLNFNLRYRPSQPISADMRFDYDPEENRVRNFSLAGQFQSRYFSITERYYRAATLQVSPGQIEPGTFPGSLLVTTINLGNERKGYYGGTSFTYDFTNRRDVVDQLRSESGLRRFSTYFGYACDCGSLEVSYSRVSVGGFRDNRINISFTLSGIGSFGTDRL
ncbi:MAG: LPS assembly protein LptD, partial [Candidatus Bathyarchaeia archaeon]